MRKSGGRYPICQSLHSLPSFRVNLINGMRNVLCMLSLKKAKEELASNGRREEAQGLASIRDGKEQHQEERGIASRQTQPDHLNSFPSQLAAIFEQLDGMFTQTLKLKLSFFIESNSRLCMLFPLSSRKTTCK